MDYPEIVRTLRAAGCVFAEDEAKLLLSTTDSEDALAAMVRRRVAGQPLEHILGWAEFCGLRIAVADGVFVPRKRTEFLVRTAAGLIGPGSVVLDPCCGAGALGAALLSTVDGIEIHAADIDPAAVGCARRNLGERGQVYEGDLDAPLPSSLRGAVDVIVANVPYVPTEAIGMMPPEAREHEARIALDGGADGLDVLRRLAAAAPGWLKYGGSLLIETSVAQAETATQAFVDSGLTARVVGDEELGATVVVGTFRPPARVARSTRAAAERAAPDR